MIAFNSQSQFLFNMPEKIEMFFFVLLSDLSQNKTFKSNILTFYKDMKLKNVTEIFPTICLPSSGFLDPK